MQYHGGVAIMLWEIGLVIGVFSIASAIMLWFARRRTHIGTTQSSLGRMGWPLMLMLLALGLWQWSEALDAAMPSLALWPVLTAVFGFLALCGCIAVIVTFFDRRHTAGG
jgi:hypothetical protein